MDDDFEWDAAKARSNLAKHKVSFELAREMFRGPCFEMPEAGTDHGEVRVLSIGEANGRCLVVIHTERDGRTRIISARRANRHEQALYYEHIHRGD